MLRSENFKPVKKRTLQGRLFRFLVLLLLVTTLLRFFLLEGFSHAGSAMLPTVAPGDGLLVNRLVFGVRVPPFRAVRFPSFSKPAHGDVVLYYHPWRETPAGLLLLLDYLTFGLLADSGRSLVLGRIAAVPGDRIRLDATGALFRGGKRVTRVSGAPYALEYRFAAGQVMLSVNGKKIKSGPAVSTGTGVRRFEAIAGREGQATVLLRKQPGEVFPPDLSRSPALLKSFVGSFLRRNRAFSDGLPVLPSVGKGGDKKALRYSLHDNGAVTLRHPEYQKPLTLIEKSRGHLWLVVPDGFYFILNDNRLLESDSRSCGFVSAGRLEGSLLFRVLPLGGDRPIP